MLDIAIGDNIIKNIKYKKTKDENYKMYYKMYARRTIPDDLIYTPLFPPYIYDAKGYLTH